MGVYSSRHGCLRVEGASSPTPFQRLPGPAAPCARQSLIDRPNCQEHGFAGRALQEWYRVGRFRQIEKN
jgi:hypothetical protein